MHVKKDDIVVVISGKDKGKKGKVIQSFPKESKVLVENINMITKHKKPTQQMQQGGIVRQEGPIDASKVMLFCEKCNRGVRTGHKFLTDGKKVRYCKKCNETFNN
ncbi:MAG: large subunit ribosomal protein [Eubacteriaceae bacterium]|jgi:large subunit ribosomal protein L24|nr:large subunit ribosomal protein [Eubacteriaceae bacterium]